MKGKKRGSKAQKISLWRKNGIQKIAEHKAHKCGMRISHICAWGTSKLAFDGTGELKRDDNNKANATFKRGKRYNADLNASYNIGARYFIRELLKPLSEMTKSQALAKVPETERRTTCTYSSLLKLNKFLSLAA
jgi:transposase